MGIQSVKRILVWGVALWMLTCSCGGGPRVPNLIEHDRQLVVEPGHLYRPSVEYPLDLAEQGMRWVLGDFGAALNERAVRFIELLDAYGAPASLGIVTHLLLDDEVELAAYRAFMSMEASCGFTVTLISWRAITVSFEVALVGSRLSHLSKGMHGPRESSEFSSIRLVHRATTSTR